MTQRIGRIEAVFAAPAQGSFVTTPVSVLQLDHAGIVGDRHAGLTRRAGPREPWLPRGNVMRNDRQLSAVCPDELAAIADTLQLPQVLAVDMGANLLIAGLAAFSAIDPGARLAIGGTWRGGGHFDGGAILRVEAYNRPCRKTGRQVAATASGRSGLDLAFVRAARRLRGLVLSVDCPGPIAPGDDVVLLPALRPA